MLWLKKNNDIMKFNECGVSEDNQYVMGIGLPSTGGDPSGWNKIIVKNECPFCHQATIVYDYYPGSNYYDSACKGRRAGSGIEGSFFCKNCDADFSASSGKEHMSPPRGVLTVVSGPDASSKEEAEQLKQGNMTDSGVSGSSAASSNAQSQQVSPLLTGESTFEDIIGEICEGIDILFLIKRNMILVTDFETIYSDAVYIRENSPSTVKDERVRFWQMEDGSFSLNVDQYGFYNTVILNWANGTVTEDYEDLVRIYGINKIEYDDPNITSKTLAIMKARSLLAAHLRDFNMETDVSILWDGDIDVGDIVTCDNPMTIRDTRKETGEFWFVDGYTVSWDDGGPIKGDLKLKYAPESPERLDIAEWGVGYASSSDSSSTTSTTSESTDTSDESSDEEESD